MAHAATDLTAFAARLDAAAISYRLSIHRDDAVSFLIAVPGERWEVDFMADGTIEVEVFTSDGSIADGSHLEDLFTRHNELRA